MAIPRSIYPNSGVKGLDVVMANLQKELARIEGKTLEGLIRAGVEIRRATEKQIPLTPVDLGNLRASWFLVSIKGSEPDPEGHAGNFRNRPFKKMQNKASTLKAEHNATIKEAQQIVNGIKDPVVITGYSANYAMWVHEMEKSYPDVTWSRQGSGGKWFQAAIASNRNEIVRIVGKYAKIS